MDEEFWRIKMEELDIESDVIDEFFNQIKDNQELTINKPFIDLSKEKIIELQNEFNKTSKTDFRKRAQIMARIISAKIE